MLAHRRWIVLTLLILTLLFTLTVSAQTPTPADPNANIAWPPPVYVLRGNVTVYGSANMANMASWFLEYGEYSLLEDTADIPTWEPATLPSRTAVRDGVLGIWDTTLVPDGVYVLRLNIVMTNNSNTYIEVAALRVENTPPSIFNGSIQPVALPTFAPTGPTQALPTLLPTPTGVSGDAQVTATRNANVRRGDGTNYDVIGSLPEGQTVRVLGISSLGTGWYLVQLPDGNQGWVAPSVVTPSGDFRPVPRVNPPPPPTATAIPFTATPASTVNLVAGNFRFDPPSPRCAQTFNIYIDVANFGSTPSPSGVISVQDFRQADGGQQGSTTGAFPVIQPGQTVNVGPIPLTISTFYNENHRLLMVIDPGNLIIETNEGDNSREAIYVLEKASCP
jgi:hypothetical protein